MKYLLLSMLFLTGCSITQTLPEKEAVGPYIKHSGSSKMQVCSDRLHIYEMFNYAVDNGCRGANVPYINFFILQDQNCMTFECGEPLKDETDQDSDNG
jgi:hypothetical protein